MPRPRPVADAGRMALTNYVVQIAVLDLLFSGYGVGLRERQPMRRTDLAAVESLR